MHLSGSVEYGAGSAPRSTFCKDFALLRIMGRSASLGADPMSHTVRSDRNRSANDPQRSAALAHATNAS